MGADAVVQVADVMQGAAELLLGPASEELGQTACEDARAIGRDIVAVCASLVGGDPEYAHNSWPGAREPARRPGRGWPG